LKIALFLIGYGNVAQRFVRLLDESKAYLDGLGVEPVILAAITRHGRAVNLTGGLQHARLAEAMGRDMTANPEPLPFLAATFDDPRARQFPARVLVETTTLDIHAGEPAISHVRAALSRRIHVITANKGPAAFAYCRLASEAARAGVSFLFEGAVMDGIPIFNLVRETMPGVVIRGFRGVVNTTTNYLLAAMERGETFEAALARMQAAGVAEADPSLDVDGWDAAAKTAALANVWLGADLTPHLIDREGITDETGARARDALTRGRRLKLVASAAGIGHEASGRVELVELPLDDPLAILEENGNALEIETWPLGRIVITQRDGGLEKTAYALLTDLVAVARRELAKPTPR
jgi:homoserine dehydrogenase